MVVYLTRNGHGVYGILTMAELDELDHYRTVCALIYKLRKAEESADACILYEKTVRNFFEMINFSNYYNMVSDRGKHPMSESCCGSSVGRAQKNRVLEKALAAIYILRFMGSIPIPAGFYYWKGRSIG